MNEHDLRDAAEHLEALGEQRQRGVGALVFRRSGRTAPATRPEQPVLPPTAQLTELPQPVPAQSTSKSLDRTLPPKPQWRDLAENRPGQQVRAEAEARLADMRERRRVGTLLARAFDVKTDERAYRVGAKGEEAGRAAP